ncbi:hypothetical protein AD937_00230 [Gluconobacter japonicus]|nr:hypothetical protein AD937_00230 [Gluconobacter japonicus]
METSTKILVIKIYLGDRKFYAGFGHKCRIEGIIFTKKIIIFSNEKIFDQKLLRSKIFLSFLHFFKFLFEKINVVPCFIKKSLKREAKPNAKNA